MDKNDVNVGNEPVKPWKKLENELEGTGEIWKSWGMHQ
jgi:hypothetical protein